MSTRHASTTNAVVVGAGVVGLSTALYLQRHGWRVTLLDRNPPGLGTSFGNACTFATYAVEPIATPGIWRQAPGMLLRRDSPLSIRPSYLPALAPWLIRFLGASASARVATISRDLKTLLAPCMQAWTTLLDDAQAHDLVRHDGSLYIFEAHRRQQALAMIDYHHRFEVPMRLVEEPELRILEPALNRRAACAVELPEVSRTLDPYALSLRLYDRFIAAGGVFRRGELTRLGAEQDDSVTAMLSGGERLQASRLVLCTGAWSRDLARQLGDDIPQDTERGYHVLFDQAGAALHRPVCWPDGGFYMTPMAQGLRVAGTVELAGLHAPPRPARYDYLTQGARRFLHLLHEPSSRWMGYRSSIPDSMPVLGPSRHFAQVFYNFGHGHIGLTLGAMTGLLTAQAMSGLAPQVNIEPFRASRFDRRRPARGPAT